MASVHDRSERKASLPGTLDMSRIEVVAPNLKFRLSGVTSTIVQLVPVQARTIGIATIGPGLPDSLPKMRWWQLPALLGRPASGRKRIWHARRNTEMVAGLLLEVAISGRRSISCSLRRPSAATSRSPDG